MASYFQLVSICDNKFKYPIIVPTEYVREINDGQLYVKYMEPPFEMDDVLCLEEFIKNKIFPPPESWPFYKCINKGYAATYNEALLLLQTYMNTSTDVSRQHKEKNHLKANSTNDNEKNSKLNENIENNGDSLNIAKRHDNVNKRLHVTTSSEDKTDPIKKKKDGKNLKFDDLIKYEGNTVSKDTSKEYLFDVPVLNSSSFNADFGVENKSVIRNQEESPSKKQAKIDSERINVNNAHESRKESDVVDITTEVATKEDLNELKRSLIRYIDKHVVTKTLATQVDIQEIKTLIFQQKPLSERDNIVTFSKLQDLFSNYEFPLRTIDEFDKFNIDLSLNKNDIKTNLKKHILSTFSPHIEIKDNVTVLVRRFLSRDVCIYYTAQKKSGDKPIFIQLPFYVCLEDSFIQLYGGTQNVITDKEVKKSISKTLSNAKDWDGHRMERTKKVNQSI